jgi:hypothetical protein
VVGTVSYKQTEVRWESNCDATVEDFDTVGKVCWKCRCAVECSALRIDLDDPSGTRVPYISMESTAKSVPPMQPSAFGVPKNSFSFATL